MSDVKNGCAVIDSASVQPEGFVASASLINDVPPAGEIVARLIADAERALAAAEGRAV